MLKRTTSAIILRCRPYRETSTLADLLTPAHGLLRVIAKGDRRTKSPLHGRIREFALGDADYLSGGGSGPGLLSDFRPYSGGGLPVSLESAALFYYCGELAAAAAFAREESEALFALMRSLLSDSGLPGGLRTAALWFEVNWLNSLGLLPSLEHCAGCRGGFGGTIYLDPEGGGFFCGRCRPPAAPGFPAPGVMAVFRHLFAAPLSRARRLRLSESQQRAATAIVRSLIDTNLDRPLKSRRFLESLARSSPVP